MINTIKESAPMTLTSRRTTALAGLALLVALGLAPPAAAAHKVGDKATLYKSIDENLKPVDMATLITDRPLVLAIGSAS
jgi:hypothetical protein